MNWQAFRNSATPTASLIPAQGKILGSPDPRPLRALKARFTSAMRQAVGLRTNANTRHPRALPWAGMNEAFGLAAGGQP